MKARSNSYSISIAPTGRARCRVCKGLVARGEVRIVTYAPVCEKPRRSTCFVRHAVCVDAALAAAVLMAGGVGKVKVVGPVDPGAVESVRESLRSLVCVGEIDRDSGVRD